MEALLITIKLRDPQIDYADLVEIIKDFECLPINNWTYVLETKLSPQHIYDTLRPHLESQDTLLVLTLKNEWQGRGPDDMALGHRPRR